MIPAASSFIPLDKACLQKLDCSLRAGVGRLMFALKKKYSPTVLAFVRAACKSEET